MKELRGGQARVGGNSRPGGGRHASVLFLFLFFVFPALLKKRNFTLVRCVEFALFKIL
jgi:hypothetical protein